MTEIEPLNNRNCLKQQGHRSQDLTVMYQTICVLLVHAHTRLTRCAPVSCTPTNFLTQRVSWVVIFAVGALAVGMTLQLLLPRMSSSAADTSRTVLLINIVMTYVVGASALVRSHQNSKRRARVSLDQDARTQDTLVVRLLSGWSEAVCLIRNTQQAIFVGHMHVIGLHTGAD